MLAFLLAGVPARSGRSALFFALMALAACGTPPPTTTANDHGNLGEGSGDGDGSGQSGGDGDAQEPGATVSLKSCGADNPAGLDDKAIKTLLAGGDPGKLRILYPYDGTVFPRGLASPVLMWDGADDKVDAVYVHMKSSAFEFEGCLKADKAGQLTLPQNVWDQAAAGTTGKSDPFQIELSVLSGGKAIGPVQQELIIAPGSLKGSIYYNSYSSSIAKKAGASGGAVLRIPPGGKAELFVGQRGCAGCHGASADGKRLVTNEGVYALTPGISVNPPPLRMASTEFVGLTPDGTLYAYQGKVVETDTGTTLPSTGLPSSAMEIAWSPDGRWVSFIDGPVDPRGGAGIPAGIIPCIGGLPIPGCSGSSSGGSMNNGKIAIMSFDKSSRTMADRRLITNVSDKAQWPLFLPDNKGLIYADTATNDLMLLDVQSGSSTILARAMGFHSLKDVQANKSFLPYAADGESRQAYFPTVAPVAAGGYFWVYFDTPRRYGNMDTNKIESGLTAPMGIAVPQIPALNIPGLGSFTASKQLWVTAIEISPDGTYKGDASAPAFYLPGQEMGANNHRAFSALDPCLETGDSCDSGIKCCSGFCSDKECVAPPSRCAQTEEACQTQSDCCNEADQCIGGFCSVILL